MRIVTVTPSKRIDPAQLRAELLASGVPLHPPERLSPLRISDTGDALVLVIDAGEEDASHDAAVQQAIAAHVPPTPPTRKQRRKARMREILAQREEQIVLLMATQRELYESLVQTRAWCSQMRQQLLAAGLPITVPVLNNRTWEQALAAVLSRADNGIDAEVDL